MTHLAARDANTPAAKLGSEGHRGHDFSGQYDLQVELVAYSLPRVYVEAGGAVRIDKILVGDLREGQGQYVEFKELATGPHVFAGGWLQFEGAGDAAHVTGQLYLHSTAYLTGLPPALSVQGQRVPHPIKT